MTSFFNEAREAIPRLPSASVEKSCADLLEWAAPLLTEEE